MHVIDTKAALKKAIEDAVAQVGAPMAQSLVQVALLEVLRETAVKGAP